jgi:hypothetical protein
MLRRFAHKAVLKSGEITGVLTIPSEAATFLL